jgi:DNA-binding NarL/FixJ family response regulator
MTRVLVVAAVRFYRDGPSEILEEESGLGVVTAASTCGQALDALERQATDVVLLDAALTDAHGAARNLALAGAPTIVVIGVAKNEAKVIAWAEHDVSGGPAPVRTALPYHLPVEARVFGFGLLAGSRT